MTSNSEDERQNPRIEKSLQAFGTVVENKWNEPDPNGSLLVPSNETQMIIDNEGSFLSPTARYFVETQAYFYERFAQSITNEMNLKPENFAETKAEIQACLDKLDSECVSLLDSTQEYPVLTDVLDSLVDIIEVTENNSQPSSVLWHNVSKRLETFSRSVNRSHAKDEVEKQLSESLLLRVSQSIYSRIPDLIQRPLKGEMEKFIQDLSGSTMSQSDISNFDDYASNIEADFDRYEDYLEMHCTYEEKVIDIEKDKALKVRRELQEIINQKGTNYIEGLDMGKHIIIEGEDIREKFGTDKLQIWLPSDDFPLHITAIGLEEGKIPHYVSIESDGQVSSAINVFDDQQESLEAAEKFRNISDREWGNFISEALVVARNYIRKE